MMKNFDITRLRLHNQGLSEFRFTNPSAVVTQLGAVQAQDYAGAKWALGQRMQDATDTAIDQSFNNGEILRTHLMRPTWHFVTPSDIPWMLMLTGPRVQAGNGFMYRKTEMDKAVIRKSYRVLERALSGNKHLTRNELGSAFEKAGIIAEGQRLGYFMMSAELDGIICSGPRKGKQFTYALLEERVAQVKALTRDEALAELTKRYFATRGPATSKDFTWWSGLTMADARNGIDMVKSQFVSEVLNGQTYWFAETQLPAIKNPPTAYLLPNYDEYFIGFKDRSAIGEVATRSNIDESSPALIAHVIILDGQIIGGWKRTIKKNAVSVEVNLITNLTKVEKRAVAEAADRYGQFLGLAIQLNW